MKNCLGWIVLAVTTFCLVGCGPSIPDPSEIPENPKANPADVKKGIQEMQDRMEQSAGGRPIGNVDVEKQTEATTGGGN